jgi:dihydrofolate reductase
MELHQWVFKLEAWRRQQGLEGGEVNASTPVVEEAQAGAGATVMGRNMFGGGPGPGPRIPPNGWWGDNPPFHTPVFVLTHHPREPWRWPGRPGCAARRWCLAALEAHPAGRGQ